MLKNLTLLGMSGVGKTYLATLLNQENSYYHYSGDYRLGSKYLSAEILQNIINKAKTNNYLKSLIEGDAIKINNNISFDNLQIVSDFLGKVGNPLLGGLGLAEFKYRQNLHLEAEKQAMRDVNKFMQIAKNQGFENFINDAGGSLCELDDIEIYEDLADKTTIIYIKADDDVLKELISRAITHPKPLYYNPDFLDIQLKEYLLLNNLTYVAQISPDDFVAWVFPHLVKYRQPKYQNIADKYGKTINAKDLYQCKNTGDFLELCH
jgi:hypothetical protein